MSKRDEIGKGSQQPEAKSEATLNPQDAAIWRAKLSLARRHWHALEDVADRVRRQGIYYRPSPSDIVRAVLDAVIPALRAADYRPLVEETVGLKRTASRAAVRAWMERYVATAIERHGPEVADRGADR